MSKSRYSSIEKYSCFSSFKSLCSVISAKDENAKHGPSTKYLLEALNGAADKNAKTGNKDGKVTLDEVKAYLGREMTY